MKTLAKRIAHQLLGADDEGGHCTVYEEESQRLWPIDMDNRRAAIERFAEAYGFQLICYKSGICAIFGKESSRPW